MGSTSSLPEAAPSAHSGLSAQSPQHQQEQQQQEPHQEKHHQLQLQQKEFEEQVQKWIAAHTQGPQEANFEATYSGAKLKKSSCPVVPFTYQSALTDDSFGISFKRAITAEDALKDLQDAVDYMWIERLSLSDFMLQDGWETTAVVPSLTFADGEQGQKIKLEFFDGSVLRWSVDTKVFSGICMECSESTTSFEVSVDFRGLLHFECLIKI
eukprot:TRINITY_DN5623_c0_g3_i1.p1 TRINITY_DN5623_c0_g3~~TRINITY_DN5623_c0_g3_i1.p1  ORF type:complete len:211 (-),score=41.97 TRINITY_DN5623_c0_g3_i1:645-1277(-)